MSDYTDWLGPAADDLTDEQREAFESAADAYYALPLHGSRDLEDQAADQAEDDAVLAAILQGILGEDTATAASHRSREARAALVGWVRAEIARGASEVAVAEATGVTRMTVRSWIGK